MPLGWHTIYEYLDKEAAFSLIAQIKFKLKQKDHNKWPHL